MKSNRLLRSFALLAALAMTVPAFAKPFIKTINIAQNAKFGKADLKAGEYRLLIDGNKATVQKGKEVVGESEGRCDLPSGLRIRRQLPCPSERWLCCRRSTGGIRRLRSAEHTS